MLTLGLAAGATALAIALVVTLIGLKQWPVPLDLLRILNWIWYFRGDPEMRRWLAIGLLTSQGLIVVTAVGLARGLRPPLHGAARWATPGEIARAGLRARHGLLLGQSSGRLLAFGGSEHVMLSAPTRSGKGVGVVIPNLLTWPHSVVVLDVKRENWSATAGFRAAHGQTVLLFDPLDADGRTARFNPLGHIDRTDGTAVFDELQRLATMLFPTPPNSDPFWAEAARTGFIGVGAYVAETPALPFSLGAIYRELTLGDGRARWPAILAERAAAGVPLSAPCRAALGDFASASENTFASIRQTISARMNLWLNPRVCAATEASDFDLRDLRRQKISLYLATSPDNLARVAPLYNLLFQQLIDLNTRTLPRPGLDPHQVLVVLDEFARLGHASVLAQAFSYAAGYGLRLLCVLQSHAQLRAEYGPDLAEEICANCGVEIAFAPQSQREAQALSDRLGHWTLLSRATSRPAGLASGRRSLTESEHRRALMLPQELLQMPADQLLILKPGVAPIRGRKLVFWRDPRFRDRVRPPPQLRAYPEPGASATDLVGRPLSQGGSGPQGDLDRLVADLVAAGHEPPPPAGASAEAVEAWAVRFIDASVEPALQEAQHGR